MTAIVVPAKRIARAKSRLSPPLSDAAREALARQMLDHVLGIAEGCAAPGALIVATDCAELAEHVGRFGARALLDPDDADTPRTPGHLGRVLDHALNAAHEAGHGRALVLMADLPRLQRSDVTHALSLLQTHDAVIAPDRRKAGCNALGLAIPAAETCFGHPDSFRRQLRQLRAHGIDTATLICDGLSFDVDTPADLPSLPGEVRPAPWDAG